MGGLMSVFLILPLLAATGIYNPQVMHHGHCIAEPGTVRALYCPAPAAAAPAHHHHHPAPIRSRQFEFDASRLVRPRRGRSDAKAPLQVEVTLVVPTYLARCVAVSFKALVLCASLLLRA